MLRPPSDFYVCEDSDYLDIQVKPSQLPVGEGLYAKKDFKPQEIIGQYRGIVIDTKFSMDEAYYTQDKMVMISDKYCILGRTAVAKANDIVKFQPQKYGTPEYKQYIQQKKIPDLEGYVRNAQIQVFDKDRVILKAIKPIKAGEEIFTAYGFDYWNFFLSLKYDQMHPSS